MFLDFLGHIVRRGLFFEYWKIMNFAGYCFTQKSNSFLLVGNDQILASVSFFLAGIVGFLFLAVLRSLDWSFRTINENLSGAGESSKKFFQGFHFSHRQGQFLFQGFSKDLLN